jgi:hypothetical protein
MPIATAAHQSSKCHTAHCPVTHGVVAGADCACAATRSTPVRRRNRGPHLLTVDRRAAANDAGVSGNRQLGAPMAERAPSGLRNGSHRAGVRRVVLSRAHAPPLTNPTQSRSEGVVKLSGTVEPGLAKRRDTSQMAVSVRHSCLSDVVPGGVCLGAELSVGGGGESVSTRAEVVGDGAKRDQETLRVLG